MSNVTSRRIAIDLLLHYHIETTELDNVLDSTDMVGLFGRGPGRCHTFGITR